MILLVILVLIPTERQERAPTLALTAPEAPAPPVAPTERQAEAAAAVQTVVATASGAAQTDPVVRIVSGAAQTDPVARTVSGAAQTDRVARTVSGAAQTRPVTRTVSGAAQTRPATRASFAPQLECEMANFAAQTECEMVSLGLQTEPPTRGVAAQTEPVGRVSLAAQTEPVAKADLAAQTECEMVSLGAQTDPLVRVSLAPWRQAPLDLVICVDSSASFCKPGSAGPGGFVESCRLFDTAKVFVDLLAAEMQSPEVQLALIRFEDEAQVICPLTEALSDFRSRAQAMAPSIGETKLAPALRSARGILASRSAAKRLAGWSGCLEVERAVLVITDGDPPDLQDSREAARLLRDDRVQLIFVAIDRVGRVEPKDSLAELANARPTPPRASQAASRPTPPPGQGVFEAKSGVPAAAALAALVPHVLQQLLRVARHVTRTKVEVLPEPYIEASPEELDACPGLEVINK